MPDEIVLNHEMSTYNEAVINFGKEKMNLLANIYKIGASATLRRQYILLLLTLKPAFVSHDYLQMSQELLVSVI